MLTRRDTIAIRSSDRSARDLAWEFNVTVDTIYKVKDGTIPGKELVPADAIDWEEFHQCYKMCRTDEERAFLVDLAERGLMHGFKLRIYKFRWKATQSHYPCQLDIDPQDHHVDVQTYADSLGLPEYLSQILVLRLQGQTYRDIAEHLQLPLASVATRMKEIVRALEQDLYNKGHK